MPIEIPYIPPEQYHAPAIEPPAQQPQPMVSVGTIAKGVFIGNLITSVVVGILWWVATHLL